MTDRAEAVRVAVDHLVDALLAAVAAPRDTVPAVTDRLLSLREAAAALGVSRTALYAELSRGHLRSFKVGRRRLIPSSVVAEYISSGGSERDE